MKFLSCFVKLSVSLGTITNRDGLKYFLDFQPLPSRLRNASHLCGFTNGSAEPRFPPSLSSPSPKMTCLFHSLWCHLFGTMSRCIWTTHC